MKDIKNIPSEKLAEQYDQWRTAIKELKEGMDVVSDELADRLKALKINGSKFGIWQVTVGKGRILTGDIPLSVAEELGCTVKKIDAAKVDSLIKKGIKIKGAKYGKPSVYVTDTTKEKNE